MSKRLQVVLPNHELEGYSRSAQADGMTLSEWVRQALRVAERERSTAEVDGKLALVRRAVAGESQGREVDIETMLEQTEAGRLGDIADMGGPGVS
jgi:hypothetical protein